MTHDQIIEAIAQMRVQCDLKMPEYELCSARGVLHELGYDEAQTDAVLLHIAEGGFAYCLDSSIACKGGDRGEWTRPTQDVCYWGPDQLRSRLDSLSNAPRAWA
jgi:hypothetical protein